MVHRMLFCYLKLICNCKGLQEFKEMTTDEFKDIEFNRDTMSNIHSLIHSSIHLCIQHIFIGILLCA